MGSSKKPAPANLRPRYEPPTLEEALFAAEGLSDDRDHQIAIAAELMDLPHDCVFHKAEAYFKAQKNRVTIEAAHRPGAEVVVETRSRAPVSLERRSKAPIAAFSFERKTTGPRFVVETRTSVPKRIITLPR